MDDVNRDRPATSTETPPIPFSAELARKSLHLASLVLPLGVILLGRTLSIAILVPLSILAFTADYLRVRSEAFARFIYTFFGFMMRQEERPPVGGPVSINGATWVLCAMSLLVILFPIRIAVPVFVMFMVGDAAAALVGRRFGRTTWGKGPRTVEGSAAFLLVGLLIMAAFPDVAFWVGAVGVVLAAGAEAMPGPFNDNIRVPVVAAGVILLLENLPF